MKNIYLWGSLVGVKIVSFGIRQTWVSVLTVIVSGWLTQSLQACFLIQEAKTPCSYMWLTWIWPADIDMLEEFAYLRTQEGGKIHLELLPNQGMLIK